MSGDVPADQAAAELERLRRLVGPNEHSYDDLVAELRAAEQGVRAAEAAAGELRAENNLLRIELRRARQDQYHVWKLAARPWRLVRALKRTAGPGG